MTSEKTFLLAKNTTYSIATTSDEVDDQLRMHQLQNELNSLKEQLHNLWDGKVPSEWLHLFKKSCSGNFAKCRLCGLKISRAARQSNLALFVHLKGNHAELLAMQEEMECLQMALVEMNDGHKEGRHWRMKQRWKQ